MLAGVVTVFLLLGAAAAETNSVKAAQSVDGHRSWQIGSGPGWGHRKLADTNSVNAAQSTDGHRSWQIGSDPSWGHRKLSGAQAVESTDGHRSWQIGSDPSWGHRKLSGAEAVESTDGHRSWQIGSDPSWGHRKLSEAVESAQRGGGGGHSGPDGRKLLDSKVPEGCADATGKFGGDPNCGQTWPGKKLLASAEIRPVAAATAAATAQSGLVEKMGERRLLSTTPAASSSSDTPHSAPKKANQTVGQRLRALFSPHRASHPSAPVKVATIQNNVANNKSDKVTPKLKESALRGSWGYYSPWGVYRTAYSTAGWGGPSACAAADVAMSCSYGRKLRMMLRL